MTPEDTVALNNLDALRGQFQNWVDWLQTARDIINNGRPSDAATIVDLNTQLTSALATVTSLTGQLTTAGLTPAIDSTP